MRAIFENILRQDAYVRPVYAAYTRNLENVMAGWQLGDPSQANGQVRALNQDDVGIEQVPALPQVGNDIDQTALGRLLQQTTNYLEARIAGVVTPNSSSTGLMQEINRLYHVDPQAPAPENNPKPGTQRILRTPAELFDNQSLKQRAEGLAGIQTRLLRDNPKHPRRARDVSNWVMTNVVMKERVAFEKAYPLQITANDSSQQIQTKVATQNAAFSQHIRNMKAGINEGIENPQYHLKGNAMEKTAEYTNKAFAAAAKYEGEFKQAKQSLLEHTNTTLGIIQYAAPETALETLTVEHEALERKLHAVLEKQDNATPEHTALVWAVAEMQAEARAQQNPTQENIQTLNDCRAPRDDTTNPHGRPTDYDTHKEAIAEHVQAAKPIVRSLIRNEAEGELISATKEAYDLALADSQNEEEPIDNNPLRQAPTYQLAKAQLSYKDALEGYQAAIYHSNNPHPGVLKLVKQSISAIEKEYKNTVKQVHKAAGTYKTLEAISAPLDVLRNNPNGNKEAARLPVLDIDKYDLSNARSNSVLANLHHSTTAVNALLAERENMERAIEANPALAKNANYMKKVDKNSKAINEKKTQFERHGLAAQTAGFLETHPDIQQWSEKVTRCLNTKALKSTNQHNPEAAKELETATVGTKYYVQQDLFKWKLVTHKTEITQRDGSKVSEDVIFSKAEFNKHLADFCEQHGLDPDMIKIKETSSGITCKWPNPKIKEAWLNHLSGQYKEKRAKELDTPQHEATVDVATDDTAITGAPPAPADDAAPALGI